MYNSTQNKKTYIVQLPIEWPLLEQENKRRHVMSKKSKITKLPNSEENSKQKVHSQMANQKPKHIKQIDNKCHISE